MSTMEVPGWAFRHGESSSDEIKTSLTKKAFRNTERYCAHGRQPWDCETCVERNKVLGLAARAKSAATLRKRVVTERRLVARLEKQLRNAQDALSMNESRLEALLT